MNPKKPATLLATEEAMTGAHMVPLMFFHNGQDIIREMARVLRKPEELLELTFQKLHLGLLPCQCVPHTLQEQIHVSSHSLGSTIPVPRYNQASESWRVGHSSPDKHPLE